MNNKRAELHLHTKLSDDVSVVDVEEILNKAEEYGLSAIGFTNLNNVQDFPAIAKQFKPYNLKIIYGAELRYKTEMEEDLFGITLLVKNQDGIKDLYKIISSLHNDSAGEIMDLDILKRYRHNLLIGSCGNRGEIYAAIAAGKDAEQIASFYDYLEIYPTTDEKERATYQQIFALGEKLGIPVVASGNVHYLDEQDEICRRVIRTVNGHAGDNRQLFLHTTADMLDKFSYLGENAKAVVLETPNQIADQIEQVLPVKLDVYPPTIENAYEQVCELAYQKAKAIYGQDLPQPIAKRLETELRTIKKGDYANHYLIAHRMVKNMNDQGYYVGARGSVGSVLVAFLLGIADTNPLPPHYYCTHCHYADFDVAKVDGFDLPNKVCPVCKSELKADGHHIPFEFFMGYDGRKMPDIDLGFPASKQYDKMVFLQELFGENRVARAGTIGLLWDRVAEGYIAYYECETGTRFDEEQRAYIRRKMCGVKRCQGTHPGGVFVLPEGMDFEDFTPLREDKTHLSITRTTHFDFHDLHNTIIKWDILGPIVPDMLKKLEELTGKSISDVVWNDKAVYSLFEKADTLGIPEFDSDFMRNMLQVIRPTSFDDLVRITGLSHGTNTWTGNGENLLQSGYTVGELPSLREDVFLQLGHYGVEPETAFNIADYVRRGRLSLDNDRTYRFIEDLQESNVPEWYIQSLRKIRYMFPKAHAVTYAMNAVRMAWFKTYYPQEFYEAYLTCYFDGREDLDEKDLEKYNCIKAILNKMTQ